MRHLVLVDTDNLLPRPGECLPNASDLPLVGKPSKDNKVVSVTVVFALNCNSAQRVPYEWLVAFSERIRGDLAPRAKLAPLEVALVLTMPEAADELLVRLIQTAGVPANAGEYTGLWLLSNDKGLRSSVVKSVQAARLHVQKEYAFMSCRFCRDLPPFTSSQHHQPVSPTSPLHQQLNSEHLCSWAQLGTTQLPRGASTLKEIASMVEQNPFLLTQLGPTTTSLRGINRLIQLLQGATPLLDCETNDGVEVRCDVNANPNQNDLLPDIAPDSVGPSSAGRGAIAASWSSPALRAVCRTRLPWHVVASITQSRIPLAQGLGAVLDDLVLLCEPHVIAFDQDARFEVKLMRRTGVDQRISAEIVGETEAWWFTRQNGEMRCSRKFSVPTNEYNPMELELPKPIVASLIRTWSNKAVALSCICPTLPGQLVTPLRRIAMNQIGLANDENDNYVGVLALGAPITDRDDCEVLPIQYVRPSVLHSASQFILPMSLIEALKHLPLLVPIRSLVTAHAVASSELERDIRLQNLELP